MKKVIGYWIVGLFVDIIWIFLPRKESFYNYKVLTAALNVCLLANVINKQRDDNTRSAVEL